MDAEPRGIKPFILIATAFVVLGGAAGFMVWWLVREQGAPPPSATIGKGDPTIRPVDFPASVPEPERAALREKVGVVLAASEATPASAAARRDLVVAGEKAVPALLQAIYEASRGAGFSDPTHRAQVRAAADVLQAIRARSEPGVPWPSTPVLDTSASAEAMARAWFAWWSRTGGGGAPASAGGTPVPK